MRGSIGGDFFVGLLDNTKVSTVLLCLQNHYPFEARNSTASLRESGMFPDIKGS